MRPYCNANVSLTWGKWRGSHFTHYITFIDFIQIRMHKKISVKKKLFIISLLFSLFDIKKEDFTPLVELE